MITEDEARKKWCPFARLNSGANRSLHGIYKVADGTNCIASDCMAWEWFDGVSDDGTACHHTPTAMLPRVVENKEGFPLSERRGDCGLKRGRP